MIMSMYMICVNVHFKVIKKKKVLMFLICRIENIRKNSNDYLELVFVNEKMTLLKTRIHHITCSIQNIGYMYITFHVLFKI
jgi:hypothetical protein